MHNSTIRKNALRVARELKIWNLSPDNVAEFLLSLALAPGAEIIQEVYLHATQILFGSLKRAIQDAGALREFN